MIADENHLHAAERAFGIGAVETQKFIHTIQQISLYHGNFITDNRGKLCRW